MGRTAFVLGATGQVGRAAVRRLAEDGWHVRAASRGMRPGLPWPADHAIEPVHLDREDDSALAAGVGQGCDVLVDCIAFHTRHASQLRALRDRIGSAVVISSFMVYTDGAGRTFNAGPQAFPALPVPVAETQPTIAPDDDTYAGGKAAMEQRLFVEGAFPVTVLRAGMVQRLAERELGYRPVADYAASLPETVTWLVEATRHRDWREIFPKLACRWGLAKFDYAAEDRWLAGHALD